MIDDLAQARAGSRLATEAVVEALRPRIVRMAVYYARCSHEDPDDLLQEAWLGLIEALPTLDLGIGSPEQYLIQRARWRLLDAIKYARVRRCAPLEELPEDQGATDGCGLPESVMGEMCVAEFARGLKATQRAVLACLLAGFTWREAGLALGCTSANIAYHVRQIRRRYEAWCVDGAT